MFVSVTLVKSLESIYIVVATGTGTAPTGYGVSGDNVIFHPGSCAELSLKKKNRKYLAPVFCVRDPPAPSKTEVVSGKTLPVVSLPLVPLFT